MGITGRSIGCWNEDQNLKEIMKYTFTQLESIVDHHNRNALAMLASTRPALFVGPTKLQINPNEASVPSTLPNFSLGSWAGVLSQQSVPNYDLVRSALLRPNTAGDIAAVFSVLDMQNQSIPDALPVALCVGINYTQWTGFGGSQLLVDRTNMYTKTTQAITDATAVAPGQFHLIAANFFPWVTVKGWGIATGKSFNSLHEMLLLETCGFDDPARHIQSLADLLRPKWLIFHGADNCVPSLGSMVRKLLRREVICCDNISQQYQGINAIKV